MFKVNRPTHCCFISAYLMPNKLKNLRPTSFQILGAQNTVSIIDLSAIAIESPWMPI